MRNRSIVRSPLQAAQRGFSLIEIILVVVLIGGIVAFAATRILGGGDRAKVNLAKAQVQTVSEKVQQYEMDTGALPQSLEELVQSSASGWLGPYAKEAELKDPWGTPLEYRMPGETGPFDIVSLGADRAAGGDSTAADIRLEQVRAQRACMYSVAFLWEPGEYDAEFHTLNARIEAVARSMPGFVGAEVWQSTTGTRRNATYYWDTLDTLRMFSTHPVHQEAKRRYAGWYAGYHVVVAQVLRSYGDGAFAHATPNDRYA